MLPPGDKCDYNKLFDSCRDMTDGAEGLRTDPDFLDRRRPVPGCAVAAMPEKSCRWQEQRQMMMRPQFNLSMRRVMRSGWRAFRLIPAYSFIWWVFAGSDQASWIIGIPSVLLAAGVSFFLSPGPVLAFSPAGAVLFIPHFVIQSIMSGIDVLRRTFSTVPRINPGMFTYTTRLEEGRGRILLANVISLQPGTLSADLVGDTIVVHVLDTAMPVQANIREMERRIARIFPPPPADGGST